MHILLGMSQSHYKRPNELCCCCCHLWMIQWRITESINWRRNPAHKLNNKSVTSNIINRVPRGQSATTTTTTLECNRAEPLYSMMSAILKHSCKHWGELKKKKVGLTIVYLLGTVHFLMRLRKWWFPGGWWWRLTGSEGQLVSWPPALHLGGALRSSRLSGGHHGQERNSPHATLPQSLNVCIQG